MPPRTRNKKTSTPASLTKTTTPPRQSTRKQPRTGKLLGRKFEKGSTAIGVYFTQEGGVFVGLDHSCLPSDDAYPENMLVLNSHLLVVFSGGSEASREYLRNHLPNQCKEIELKEGRKASAAEASKLLADYLSSKHDSDHGVSLGVLIAGWENEAGPSLFKVDGNGKILEEGLLSIGSGSAGKMEVESNCGGYAWTVKKAAELVKEGICLGVYTAPERLEYVSVFHVGRAGINLVLSNDDITNWQKEHFGSLWRDPSTRRIFSTHIL